MKTYKIGETVSPPLNAVVLAQRPLPGPKVESVVLCVSPAHHEFVVWLVVEGDTVDGHYFFKLDEALKDYEVRS